MEVKFAHVGKSAYLEFKDYPQTIAQLRRDLSSLETNINWFLRNIENFEAYIHSSIAFDADLKNDSQRKVRSGEQLQHLKQTNREYREILDGLDSARNLRISLEIELEMRRNQFKVLQLLKIEENGYRYPGFSDGKIT